MNFQKIPPVPTSAHFLDIAFRKARRKGKSKNLTGNWLQIIRKKETLKLDIVKDSIALPLLNIIRTFPEIDALSTFYVKLLEITLDLPNFKKSLGAVSWAVKRISAMQSQYVRKIHQTKERGPIKNLTKEFYGRVSSILKQIDKHLQYLEKARKVMRTYPDVKDIFTICIYGFPNVGKSTLLNKLAGTKAVTAAYAFTTKTINSGTATINGEKVQILDVPGTLARENKLNPIELQAELVVRELADLVIYVFDVSEQGGYSVKKQKELLQKLSKKNLLIYFSKTDLDHEEIKLKQKTYSFSELKKEIGKRIK